MHTSVTIAGVTFDNPVMTASGTFGSGKEYAEYMDLNGLGGIIVKGVASKEWLGNPAPRIAETYGGMLNAVGLQNPGVDVFMEEDIPFLRQYNTNIVVNIAGKTVEEYVDVTKRLQQADIDMIELNISCPNVKEGGVAFGTDAGMAEYITKEVKKHAKQPLIVKLSPNVTDITEIAKAVEAGGADAVSLINTLLGMKIDIYKRRPVLANRVGGFSGPAIKPVAVRMVHQVYKSIQLPIIGLGGICTGEDAVEFMLAGATGVAVGTANFMNPRATVDVIEGIERFMDETGVEDVRELIGALE
ncbi:dihydroorotate dehydrogenase [Vallitalea pronyensis]|uniref:Dihydroorotate dehydrogenase n=1 Tax=Vallitalea pronyensis TaxID=1348613 RepID=A0A8J8MPA8_9FIRM|nr:dihydroorotate dehydrogenase [Vallitalea pronyensis]QUI25607.1 dihydroorotate dehydrogenase [Vallitalea pronyensis]